MFSDLPREGIISIFKEESLTSKDVNKLVGAAIERDVKVTDLIEAIINSCK